MPTTLHASELARHTPASRDRYVDFLRLASITVVVLGHWLMAVVTIDGDRFRVDNVLGMVPGLWLATWLLQVIPIFFFVGGFSNHLTVDAFRRQGRGYADFAATRVQRLIRPVAVLFAVWVPLALVLTAAGVPNSMLAKATRLVCQPLWFIAVYLAVTALAPVMRDLHARHRGRVLVTLLAIAATFDAIRFGLGNETVALANTLFVWLFAQQLGFFYADGTLTRLSRRHLAGLAGVALGVLGLLTVAGPYPGSMVGYGSGPSNMSPPSLCIAALAVFQVALVMLARPVMQRRLEGPRLWTAVIAGNGVIMTIFLWHLTAMLVAVTVLMPLGFPQPPGGSALWWATRPLWIAAAAVPLAGIIALLGRYERPRVVPAPSAPHPCPTGVAAVAVVLLSGGMVGIALSNLAQLSPLTTFVPVALGWVLLQWPSSRRRVVGVEA